MSKSVVEKLGNKVKLKIGLYPDGRDIKLKNKVDSIQTNLTLNWKDKMVSTDNDTNVERYATSRRKVTHRPTSLDKSGFLLKKISLNNLRRVLNFLLNTNKSE